MRWLNDIRIKIDSNTEVVADFMQVEGGILILTTVSTKNVYGGKSTLVLIDSTETAGSAGE